MILALAGVLAVSMMLPFVLDLRRVAPATAAALWLSALLIRAAGVALIVVFCVAVLPGTGLFSAVTHWCWHTVLPLLAAHLGVDGHVLGDAAVVLPAVALSLSVLSATFGLVRAARSVRNLLRHAAVGRGPAGSVIVGGRGVLLAAAGLARPRVVVSAGALTALDDDELAAGLDHEQGHIRRGHRFLLLVAELACSVARVVPGARRARLEFAFHLERDADRWAVARHHDPLALASAICKAAGAHAPSPVMASLAGPCRLGSRVDELLEGPPARGGTLHARALGGLAVAVTALTLLLIGSVPLAAAAEFADERSVTERHCA